MLTNTASTGQGSKICPFSDITSLGQVHVQASRKDLAARLEHEMRMRASSLSPKQKLFQKTLAFFAAFQKQGCGAPPLEETVYEGEEAESRMEWIKQLERVRRGHEPKATCDGRLVFEYDHSGAPFVRCVSHQNSLVLLIYLGSPDASITTLATKTIS